MTITHNNVLYDGSASETEESTVKQIAGLEQIYPVGSVCFLNLHADGSNLTMFLRAEVRL